MLMARPDLAITAASSSHSSAILSHDLVDLSWTVTNQGDAPAEGAFGDWYDTIYLSNDAVFDSSDQYVTYTYRSAPLAAGATYSESVSLKLPTFTVGDKYLIFIADESNEVSDSDRSNNFRAVPIHLTGPNVDLVISNPSAPATAGQGQMIDLSWTVTNQGSDDAEADWYDSIYISTVDHFDANARYVTDVWSGEYLPLASQSSYVGETSTRLPSNAPLGDVYLLFVTNTPDEGYYFSNQF